MARVEAQAAFDNAFVGRVRDLTGYLARRMVPGVDHHGIEDVAQEALVEVTKAARKLGRLDWPLVVVICRRVVNGERKRRERRERIAPVVAFDGAAIVDGMAEEVIERLVVADVLATLSADRRALLADRADGRSYEAIAAEQATTPTALRTDASRAREAIRRVWPRLGDGGLVAWWRTRAERVASMVREVAGSPLVVPTAERVMGAAVTVVAAVVLLLAPPQDRTARVTAGEVDGASTVAASRHEAVTDQRAATTVTITPEGRAASGGVVSSDTDRPTGHRLPPQESTNPAGTNHADDGDPTYTVTVELPTPLGTKRQRFHLTPPCTDAKDVRRDACAAAADHWPDGSQEIP